MEEATGATFIGYMEIAEPRLRRALVAAYGADRGREATAEAMAYAWEHWPKVRRLRNPTGYLYRVGQSRTRPRREPLVFVSRDQVEHWVEPALSPCLADLSEHQRIAVVLVHGYGWTMREVSELTGIKVTTVKTHLDRGLSKLRAALEVEHEH